MATPLTVGQLIEHLRALPQDLPVRISRFDEHCDCGGCTQDHDLELSDISIHRSFPPAREPQAVVIYGG